MEKKEKNTIEETKVEKTKPVTLNLTEKIALLSLAVKISMETKSTQENIKNSYASLIKLIEI